MFKYALKRVIRGYKLFLALTIGVLVATTFVSSLVASADIQTMSIMNEALDRFTYDARIQANNVTWNNQEWDDLQAIMENLTEVDNLDRYSSVPYMVNSTKFNVYGIERDSAVWDSFSLLNGSSSLNANETYVIASSVNASLFSINDIIEVPIVLKTTTPPFYSTTYVNLTIAGFVEISESTAYLLNPPRFLDFGFIQIEIGNWKDYNLLVTDWDLTFRPLIEYYSNLDNVTGMQMSMGYLCQLNRDLLVNPYDVGGTATNIADALSKIEDRTSLYNTKITNLVGPTLSLLTLTSGVLILAYVALSVPIIFMSWYSSTMLSEVTYNLRRREFGLLQTKGFGPGVIKRMLTFEGVIVGVIAGVSGLLIGTYLAHLIAGVSAEVPMMLLSTNWGNAIAVIIFGVILSVWSVRGPADRASKLEPLECLKQYILVEEQREYRKLLPRIALVLGTYKLIVWLLGINMNLLMVSALRTSFILFIAMMIWSPIDGFLNFAGPILFLYGITKITIRGSESFQAAIMRAGRRFFGAFGVLATRNVKRNPSRNAALVFVLSLIVSYGVFSVGGLFSDQDRIVRTFYYEVGSDVSAVFSAGTNMTSVITTINGIDGVNEVTIEYQTTMSTTRGALPVRGIDAEEWQKTAYFEEDWFSGQSFNDMFDNFTGDVIILSVSVARDLELRVGNKVTVRNPVNSEVYQLEIIGLVGYVSPLEEFVGRFTFTGSYPSYVPFDFLNRTGITDVSEAHALIKTSPGVNGTVIEDEITSRFPDVQDTDSVTSRLAEAEGISYQAASIRARWLGIIFAGVLAIIGSGLVVALTLKEKEYETVLLAVRGFTRGQILKVLFGEVMIMVLFAMILGTLTGFIQLFGDLANTSQNLQSLVRPRIVMDPMSLLGMMSLVICVFLSSLIPVLFASRLSEERINILRE